jgi:predicted small lipoprotein YifL
MLDSKALAETRMRAALLALLLGCLLPGCGLKGPLYIPTAQQERETAELEQKLKEREQREQEAARQPPPPLKPPAAKPPTLQPAPEPAVPRTPP